LPVTRSRATDSRHVLLEPYTTKTFEYYFYFPQTGSKGLKFAHYPVNTSVRGTAVAAAQAFSFNAVNRLTEVDKASWDYVSQYGNRCRGAGIPRAEQHRAAQSGTHRLALPEER